MSMAIMDDKLWVCSGSKICIIAMKNDFSLYVEINGSGDDEIRQLLRVNHECWVLTPKPPNTSINGFSKDFVKVLDIKLDDVLAGIITLIGDRVWCGAFGKIVVLEKKVCCNG